MANRHRLRLGLLDDGRAVERVLRHVHGAAADDRAAACAGTEFRKSHSNRHDYAPCLCGGVRKYGSAQITVGHLWLLARDDKDEGERKLVNHDVTVKRPVSGCSGGFRPTSGQSVGRGERTGASGAPRLWLTRRRSTPARAAIRCESRRRERSRNQARERLAAKMSLAVAKWRAGFEWLLSDLCCRLGMSIGALGQVPTLHQKQSGTGLA